MKKLYYTCIDDDIPKNTFDKISANFDKLTPDSTLTIVPVLDTKTGTVASNTVPVWGTKTGTIPSNTVPVWGTKTGTIHSNTVPVIVPVSGTKTGTVNTPNPLCYKASQSPNIDKDKDKDFHSVNSSQYDSIRTENSSKNGSIHIKSYLHYFT